jgi:hypothetical protein
MQCQMLHYRASKVSIFLLHSFRVSPKNQHSIMIDFDLNDLDGLEDIDAELARVEAELAKVQGGNKVQRFD